MIVLPEVEDKVWPFVISIIPPEPSVAFFERYFEKQMQLASRQERWVHLVDVRLVEKLPDAKVRSAVANHTKKVEALSSSYNVGKATVIKSSVVRGILTAIHWMMPPPHPFRQRGNFRGGDHLFARPLAKRRHPCASSHERGPGGNRSEPRRARSTSTQRNAVSRRLRAAGVLQSLLSAMWSW